MNREEEMEEFAKGYASLYVDNNYYAIKAGVEWADEHPRKGLVDIEKVCNFLNNIDIKKYISSLTDGVGFVNIHIGDIIEDMKKALEE